MSPPTHHKLGVDAIPRLWGEATLTRPPQLMPTLGSFWQLQMLPVVDMVVPSYLPDHHFGIVA